MTLQGAIQQLHDMRSDDNFPFYYKPAIDKVIETLQMDAQEAKKGIWMDNEFGSYCSNCGLYAYRSQGIPWKSNYCPICGARMDGEEE